MPEDRVGHRVLSGTRLAFIAIGLGALALGYLGTREFAETLPAGSLGTGFWDVSYYVMQLFVLGATPLELAGPYPLALNIARFAAPAVTGYALFEAGRALFAGQFRRWRTRTRRGNHIVVGQTPAARALVAKLLAGRRRRVVAVSAGDAHALQAAGVARANVLYAFADDVEDSTLNVATALTAAKARARFKNRRLRLYAHVSNPTLALALRARRLGLPSHDGLQVDFINLDEVAARGLLGVDDVTVSAGQAPRILVAGLGTFGRAIVVEYARRWRLSSPRREERVAVTLVDASASAAAAELAARWDIVRDVVDLTPVDGSLETALRAHPDALHRAYLCYDDEELALAEALTLVELWRGGQRSIVVRLNYLSRHGEAFLASGLVDDVGGRLRLIGVTDLACDPDVIAQDLVERLAEAIHERYLLEQMRAGRRLGDPDRPAMRGWLDLPEKTRRANRAQAADIGVKLAKVGCAVAPRTGAGDAFSFSPAEVELLAVHEHDRWSAERRAEGLRHGPTRDAKHNPSLVGWDQLPESERELDRDSVRQFPAILADVGLRVTRLTTSPTV